jgi:hypothetical protein
VVKIDNGPRALPQAGINQADVVFEEQVEGGITRLAAVFHSEDPGAVGPVRSARSTDIGLVSPLSRPLFAYSGANKVFEALVRRAPLVDVGAANFPGRYRRDGARPAPDNLFSSTSALVALAPPGAAAPPPLFAYRPADEPPSGAEMKPVGRAHAEWGNRMTTVDYDWDGPSALWRRAQNGRADVDTAGTQVAPSNVVIQFVGYRNTGLVDPSGSPVPEAQVIGQGDAWILTGGALIPSHWSKASAEAVTRYVDAGGNEVLLAPGRTWVELVPPGKASFTERPPDPPPTTTSTTTTSTTTTSTTTTSTTMTSTTSGSTPTTGPGPESPLPTAPATAPGPGSALGPPRPRHFFGSM